MFGFFKSKKDKPKYNSGAKRRKARAQNASPKPKAKVTPKPKPKPKAKPNYKAQDKKPVGAGVNLRKTNNAAKKLDNNQRVITSANRQKTAAAKATTKVAKPPSRAKSDQSAPKRSTWKDYKTASAAKKAGFANYMGKDGKKKAAVFKTDLKKGQTLREYLNEKKRAARGASKPKPKIKKPY